MNASIKRRWVKLSIFIMICAMVSCSKTKSSFQDLSHFSTVFKREKPYRIYLPETYKNATEKKYPVVYYLHGWGGVHNKDSSNLAYDSLGKLVDKYQVILVMLNGRMDDVDPRPYNMGYHEHMVYTPQMKDYFLELVSHIDSTFRTIDDRSGRGIMGFSMGGMMSLYLSGKYPDKVRAAVDLTGSTEFYIGTPDNNTFYPLRYTFTNLRDVPFRLHNSSHGELSALNEETNNGVIWEGNSDYEYWKFNGGHEIDQLGKTDAFEKALAFLFKYLQKPIPIPKNWSHYDLYKDFEVWDYKVQSDKAQPGFLFLSNVSENGFGFYTHTWLPGGPSLKNVKATVTTSPIYKPSTVYSIKEYNKNEGKIRKWDLKSDQHGRLHVELDGQGHEIGIYQNEAHPKLTFVDYAVGENGKMLRVGEENKVRLNIKNLGAAIEKNKKIKISINSRDKSVVFEPSVVEGFVDDQGEINVPFISVRTTKKPTKDASPFGIKIRLQLALDDAVVENVFLAPVFLDVPLFENVEIDDGRSLKDTIVGVGNGNGKVSSGEEIMIYVEGHRTQLYYDDPYIVSEKLFDEALPAVWQTDGITFSSIIKVSENCPKGHHLKLLTKYETKSYNPIARTVTWGKLDLVVGNDESE